MMRLPRGEPQPYAEEMHTDRATCLQMGGLSGAKRRASHPGVTRSTQANRVQKRAR